MLSFAPAAIHQPPIQSMCVTVANCSYQPVERGSRPAAPSRTADVWPLKMLQSGSMAASGKLRCGVRSYRQGRLWADSCFEPDERAPAFAAL